MLHTIAFVSDTTEKTELERRVDAAGLEVVAGPLSRLNLCGLAECDLVVVGPWNSVGDRIECLDRIEPHLSPGAILATDAPAPTVETLARGLRRPEQFLAFEWLAAANGAKPTVQIRTTVHTSPGVVQALRGFFEALGDQVIESPEAKGLASASFGRRPSRVFGPPVAARIARAE